MELVKTISHNKFIKTLFIVIFGSILFLHLLNLRYLLQ